MADKIYQSVGNNGMNTIADVITVQNLLNRRISSLKPHLSLKIDGDCGPITIGMIIEFQRRVMNYSKPDGRIDPNGNTFLKLIELATPIEGMKNKLARKFNYLLLEVQQWLKSSYAINS